MLNYNRLAPLHRMDLSLSGAAALALGKNIRKKACRKDLKIFLKINEYILLYSNSSIRSVWLENTNLMLF